MVSAAGSHPRRRHVTVRVLDLLASVVHGAAVAVVALALLRTPTVLGFLLYRHGRQGNVRVDLFFALFPTKPLLPLDFTFPPLHHGQLIRQVGLRARRVYPQGVTARRVTGGSLGHLGFPSLAALRPRFLASASFLPLSVWTRGRSQQGVTARRSVSSSWLEWLLCGLVLLGFLFCPWPSRVSGG